MARMRGQVHVQVVKEVQSPNARSCDGWAWWLFTAGLALLAVYAFLLHPTLFPNPTPMPAPAPKPIVVEKTTEKTVPIYVPIPVPVYLPPVLPKPTAPEQPPVVPTKPVTKVYRINKFVGVQPSGYYEYLGP